MATVGQILVNVTANASGLVAGFSAAEKAIERFGSRMYFMGGRIAAGVTLPLVGAFYSISRAAMDFDSEMTKAMAIADAPIRGMREEYEKTAISISKTWGFTAAEVAKGFYELHSAGMQGQIAIGGVGVMAEFARSGMMDLQKAGNTLLTVTHAMRPDLVNVGDSAEKAGEKLAYMARVGDVLNEVNRLSIGTVETFSDALKNQAAQSARYFGMSLEETTAALAAWQQQGIVGKVTGQQFWMVLRDLSTHALKNAKDWERYGISVYGAGEKMRHIYEILAQIDMVTAGFKKEQIEGFITKGVIDPLGRAAEIQEKLKTATGKARVELEKELKTLQPMGKAMTDMAKSQLMIDLGIPSRSRSALQKILGLGPTMANITQALMDSSGRTREIALEQMKSYYMQWAKISARFDAIKIQIFKAIAPILLNEVIPILEKFALALENVAIAFGKLPDSTKKFVVSTAVFVAALGPALMMLGSWTLLFGGFSGVLVGVGRTLRWLALQIATLFGARSAAQTAIAAIAGQGKPTGIWAGFVMGAQYAKALLPWLARASVYVYAVYKAFQVLYPSILLVGKELWNLVKVIGSLATRAGLPDVLTTKFWNDLGQAIDDATLWYQYLLFRFTESVIAMAKRLPDILPGLWDQLWSGIRASLSDMTWTGSIFPTDALVPTGLVSVVSKAFNEVWSVIVQFGARVADWMTNFSKLIWGIVTSPAVVLGSGVMAAWDKLTGVSEGQGKRIGEDLGKEVHQGFAGYILAMMATGQWLNEWKDAWAVRIVGPVIASLGQVKRVWDFFMGDFAAAVTNLPGALVKGLYYAGRAIAGWAAQTAASLGPNLVHVIAEAWQYLPQWFADFTIKLLGLFNAFWEGIAKGAEAAVNYVRQQFMSLIPAGAMDQGKPQPKPAAEKSTQGKAEVLWGVLPAGFLQQPGVGRDLMTGQWAQDWLQEWATEQRKKILRGWGEALMPPAPPEEAQPGFVGPPTTGASWQTQVSRYMQRQTGIPSLTAALDDSKLSLQKWINDMMRGGKLTGTGAPSYPEQELDRRAQDELQRRLDLFQHIRGALPDTEIEKYQNLKDLVESDKFKQEFNALGSEAQKEWVSRIWDIYKDMRPQLEPAFRSDYLESLISPLAAQQAALKRLKDEGMQTFQELVGGVAWYDNQVMRYSSSIVDEMRDIYITTGEYPPIAESFLKKHSEDIKALPALYQMAGRTIPPEIQRIYDAWKNMKIADAAKAMTEAIYDIGQATRDTAAKADDAETQFNRLFMGGNARIPRVYVREVAQITEQMNKEWMAAYEKAYNVINDPDNQIWGQGVLGMAGQSAVQAMQIKQAQDALEKLEGEQKRVLYWQKMLARVKVFESMGYDAAEAAQYMRALGDVSDETFAKLAERFAELADRTARWDYLLSKLGGTFRNLAKIFDKTGKGWLTALADGVDGMRQMLDIGKRMGVLFATLGEQMNGTWRMGADGIMSQVRDWGAIAGTITGIVLAIADAAVVMWNTVQSGTRAQRTMKATMSGAALGASIGTMVAPGVGTAIGAVVGAFGGAMLGAFYTPGWERAMTEVGFHYGTKISEGLAKAIEETRTLKFQWAGTDEQGREFAAAWDMDKIIQEAGGLNPRTISFFQMQLKKFFEMGDMRPEFMAEAIGRLGDLMGTFADYFTAQGLDAATGMADTLNDLFARLASGAITTADANLFFSKSFAKFAESVTASGNVASLAFATMLEGMAKFKVGTRELVDWITTQAGRAGAAWQGLLEYFQTDLQKTVNQIMGEGDELGTRWDELVAKFKGSGFTGTMSEWIAANASAIGLTGKELEKFKDKIKTTETAVGDLGVLILATFNQAQRMGLTWTQIMGQIGDSLDTWAKLMSDLGIPADDPAINKLLQIQRLFKDSPELMAAVDMLKEGTIALSGMGLMTEDMFKSMQRLGLTIFDRLSAKMTEMGLSGEDALLMMVPWLQQIEILAAQYGFTIDENIQKMIDQAKEAGMMGEHTKTAAQIMKDQLDLVILSLVTMIQAFGKDLPEALKKWLEEWNKTVNGMDPMPQIPEVPGPGDGGEEPFDPDKPWKPGPTPVPAARGVYATAPQLRWFGEAHEPELGGPVSFMSEALTGAIQRLGLDERVGVSAAAPDTGPPITIQIQAWDSHDVERVVQDRVMPKLISLWRNNYRGSRTDGRTALGVE